MKCQQYLTFTALASMGNAAALIGRAAQPPDYCKAVTVLVELLKLDKATPFCSSFLGVQPTTAVATISVPVTQTVYVTVGGATVTSYTTTKVNSVLSTEITGTVTTTVATITEQASSITTVTTTPTTTVTVLTAGGSPIKRSVEERKVNVPPYLTKFASAAVSSACSCLNIPVSTIKATTTQTISAQITSTVTSTSTILDAASSITTVVVKTVEIVPVTATTTMTAVSTVTQTAPTQTSTFVACDADRLAHSTNNLGGGMDLQQTEGKQYNDLSNVDCCVKCWGGLNCIYAASHQSGSCYIVTSTSPFSSNTNTICPNGVSNTFFRSDASTAVVFTGPCANNPWA